MKSDYEIWSVGNGDVAVYTENPKAAKLLKAMIGRGTTYERAGRAFAWQFIIPITKKRFVERKISRIGDIETKEVTPVENLKFPITATE